MPFWSKEFMNDRRKQWLDSILKFQYRTGEKWFDATIKTKRIVGDTIEIIVSLPRTDTEEQTINAVRIIDVKGRQAGYTESEVVRATNQGVLVKFEFPIYEKGDEEV